MIGLVMILGILLGFWAICLMNDTGAVIGSIGAILVAGATLFGVFYIGDCAESRIIDEKIAVYQEENDSIEKDIESVIEQYMQHEKEVFKAAKVDSAITLVQLFPNLKSDALVKQQLEVYQNNNEQIKKLKTRKLECEKSKWLLYFGGKKAGGGDE